MCVCVLLKFYLDGNSEHSQLSQKKMYKNENRAFKVSKCRKNLRVFYVILNGMNERYDENIEIFCRDDWKIWHQKQSSERHKNEMWKKTLEELHFAPCELLYV